MVMKECMSLTPHWTFLASIGGVCLLGLVDYATGYELGFFVFYFQPIAAAPWTLGAPTGYAVSLLSARVWLAADWPSRHRYSHPAVAVWETAMRLVAFVVIAYGAGKIQALRVQARQATEERQVARRPVKTLTGLLPICSACKKIRTDEDSWEEIERLSRSTPTPGSPMA